MTKPILWFEPKTGNETTIKTVVLLSGGLDSATILAACAASGDEVLALAFDYGQAHAIELRRAQEIADYYCAPFKRITIPTIPRVAGTLVFAGRNLVLTSHAVGIAQSRGFNRIAMGCNASDWAHFPDCRPKFWRDINACVEQAYGVTVLTPLIYMTKRDVVETARRLDVPIDMTWSCYSPVDSKPCGECLACKTREDALK